MKKVVLVSFFLALSVMFAALPAYATTPIAVTGKWRAVNPPPGGSVSFNVRTAGANAFLIMHIYGNYFEGDILGAPLPSPNIEQTVRVTFHYSDPEYVKTLPTGAVTNAQLQLWQPTNWNWNVERTFTGTVLGVAGGFTMKLEAKGFGRIGAPEVIEGTWVIISGTGGLENLHGEGTWHNIGVQLNEYSGQVHFDP